MFLFKVNDLLQNQVFVSLAFEVYIQLLVLLHKNSVVLVNFLSHLAHSFIAFLESHGVSNRLLLVLRFFQAFGSQLVKMLFFVLVKLLNQVVLCFLKFIVHGFLHIHYCVFNASDKLVHIFYSFLIRLTIEVVFLGWFRFDLFF